MDKPIDKLEINEKIIQQTTMCNKNFACLNGSHPCCSVERSCGHQALFIKGSDCDCLYKISFGFSSSICTCPVRKEIHRLYGK
jgi:hypothetical protein